MIARIETGSTGVSFDTIERLASAFEVDAAELFTSELPAGTFTRGPAGRLMNKIAGLKADQLAWLEPIIEAILRPGR